MTSVCNCDIKKDILIKGDRDHIKVANHMLETSLHLEFYLKFNLENFLNYLKNVFLWLFCLNLSKQGSSFAVGCAMS